MKEKLNKKPIIFILLLLLVTVVGTTFAYFYSEVIIPNQFKTKTYNVTIEEEFYDTWGIKKVSIVNKESSSTPVVIRINYNESWRKEIDDIKLSLDNNINGTNVVTKNWTNDFTNNFIDGKDGWYYYTKILNSNQSVQVLESIELNEELIKLSPYYNEYKNYNYELIFNFEAIQATQTAVKEIWEKNVTINGNDIIWE